MQIEHPEIRPEKDYSSPQGWGIKILSFFQAQKYLLLIISIASGIFLGLDWKNLKAVFPHEPPIFINDFGDLNEKIGKGTKTEGDWVAVPEGLVLNPGAGGEITFQIPKEKEEGIILTLWFFSAPGLDNQIALSRDGIRFQTLKKNVYLSGDLIDLSKFLKGAEVFWLKLSAVNKNIARSEPVLVLKQIQISKVKNPICLPDLPILFLFLIIPILGFYLGRTWFGREKAGLLLSLGFILGEIIAKFVSGDFLVRPIPVLGAKLSFPVLVYFLVLFVYFLSSFYRGRFAASKQTLARLALLGFIALAFSLQWEQLIVSLYAGLDPDVNGYKSIALEMRHLYDTDIREPLWIWIVKIWMLIAGSTDLQVKLLNIPFSLILIIAVYKFFKDYTGNLSLALLTAFIFAINIYFNWMASRGYRLEIYSVSILMFCYYVFISSEHLQPGTRLIGLTVWTTVLELIQINSLIFILPFLLYGFWKHRIRWMKMAIPLVAMAAFLSPFLIYSYQKFGDPFYSNNIHASWYRNREFGSQCAGCPTPSELEHNSFAGEKTTSFHYIFVMHRFKNVIKNTLKGYRIIFLDYSNYIKTELGKYSRIYYLLYLAGLIFTLLSRYRGLILISMFLINLIAFLIPGIYLDPRILAHVSPFFTFFLAYGVWVPLALVFKVIMKTITGRESAVPS